MSSFFPNSVPSTESTPATASAATFSDSRRRSMHGGDTGFEADEPLQLQQQQQRQQQQQQQQQQRHRLQGSRSATSLAVSDRKRRWTNPAENWLRRSATSQAESGSVAADGAESQGGRSNNNNDTSTSTIENNNNNNGRADVQGTSSSSLGRPSLTRQDSLLGGSSNSHPIDLSSSPPHCRRRRTYSHHLGHGDIGGLVVHPERQNGNNLGYFLPRWQPNSEVTKCPICKTPFSFWFRKHHCRKCGRVVCSYCSPHRITIPRQFIVRPPDLSDCSSSVSGTTVPGATACSAARFVDRTSDEQSEMSPTRINPALGGGEEVRLCNPCVPDPNPEPPRGFTAVRAGDVSGGYVFQPNQSQTRPYHSMSVPSRQRPFEFVGSSQMLPDQRVGGLVDYATSASDYSHLPLGTSPRAFTSQSSSQRPSSLRPSEGASSSSPLSRSWFRAGEVGPANPETPRRTSMQPSRTRRQRPIIDEHDLCPICNLPFASVMEDGSNGNEEDREAHVRECIDSHGALSHGSGGNALLSESQTHPHPIRMVAFTATEKDCTSHEGAIPECTICMEEYEVGQPLVRLECLCKFHQLCIVEWFDRKKECPVHKVS